MACTEKNWPLCSVSTVAPWSSSETRPLIALRDARPCNAIPSMFRSLLVELPLSGFEIGLPPPYLARRTDSQIRGLLVADQPHRLLEPIHSEVVCPWSAAHPRHDHQQIFPLLDGRLLLVWSEYYVDRPSNITRSVTDEAGGVSDEFPCRLAGRVSSDGGRTWSERFTLQENLWGRNVKHPNLIRTGDGDVVMTFTAWESDVYRNVYMKRSTDDCETWGPIEQISEPGWYCTNNDHALRLNSGRILLPSHGGPGFRYEWGELHSFVFYSDDECVSWQTGEITMTAPGRGAHEPSIVELCDGRLLCFLRTRNERVYRAYSDDAGVSWSDPVPTDLPAPDSPPLLKWLPDRDRLLLIWNCVASDGNTPRTPLTVAVSDDEGRTFRVLGDIDQRDGHAAYAAVTFQDGEALVTYYSRDAHWARDSEVTLKIYEVEHWLAA